MQLFLNKEEKFHLEAVTVKRNNLGLQDQMLKQEMDVVLVEFCKRNSVDIKNAKNLDIGKGLVEFEDKKKPQGKQKVKI
jgi:hypothetical protein